VDIRDRTQPCRRFVSGKGGEGDSAHVKYRACWSFFGMRIRRNPQNSGRAQRLLGRLRLGSVHLSVMG
jgi:hypothetical protein